MREPAERAVADLVAHLEPRAGLQMLGGDARATCRAHVVAVDRVHVQAIEERRRRRDALFLVIASIGSGRR